MSERRRGVLFGVAAYAMWGLFPLYWPLLRPAGAVEILAHRVVWSLVLTVLLMSGLRALPALRRLDRRRLGLLTLAAGLVSVNWGTYIWAVNHGHVVETSLGYFITPLVSVMLGVVFLGERLRRGQWIAVAIAGVAVAVLAADYGRLPWIALTLASSFGLYGFVKKLARVPALPSLTVETGLLFAPAMAYLALLHARGGAAFAQGAVVTDLLLVAAGVITAIPLLCFAAAANRIPLSTLGLLQYLAPVLQFLCGVLVFREAMPGSRWLGFSLVWVGLAWFSAESVRHHRRAALSSLGVLADAASPGPHRDGTLTSSSSA
jgi:chloramphenicol-sensitive protein RarD